MGPVHTPRELEERRSAALRSLRANATYRRDLFAATLARAQEGRARALARDRLALVARYDAMIIVAEQALALHDARPARPYPADPSRRA